MPKFKTLINGEAYIWEQIVFSLFNTPIAGIKAISYEDDQEVQDNYGAGNRPISRGYGNIKCTGSVTLEMIEVEALQEASPTGRVQDIPEFDVIVSFQPNIGAIRTHTLKNCRFKKNSRGMKQGDMQIDVELPFVVGEILWK